MEAGSELKRDKGYWGIFPTVQNWFRKQGEGEAFKPGIGTSCEELQKQRNQGGVSLTDFQADGKDGIKCWQSSQPHWAESLAKDCNGEVVRVKAGGLGTVYQRAPVQRQTIESAFAWAKKKKNKKKPKGFLWC